MNHLKKSPIKILSECKNLSLFNEKIDTNYLILDAISGIK